MIIKVIKKALKIVTAPQRKVMGWLFKMPDMPDAAAVMVEKQGSDHPIPVVYGTRKIGVIKVHKYVTDLSGGAENELLHLICVLCEGEIDAIEEVFFDGVSETDPRWRKDKNNPSSAKWFTVHRYFGAANQPASAAAVSGIPNWTISHTLSGLAYLYIVLQMDKEQSIWRGEPEITARVRGRKLFDPRTNTTAFSTNPAMQLLDYLKNPVYGKGLNVNRLAQSSFIAAADFADEMLNSTVIVNGTPTPFTHKRFTGNQVVDTGKSVFSNVQQMLSAMRGSLPIGSGVLRLQIELDISPVFYFSHDRSEQLNHATITGKIKSGGGNKKDRFNRVVVRFPNAALDFERDEVFYPDSEDAQFALWLAEDNGVLLEQNFEFNTVTNKAEALQMARIIALRSRFQLQCSFVASPAAIVVEPGDVVAITDDTRGWDAKPFRAEQVKLKDDGDVELEFIEHQNAIYPWSGTTYEERIGGTNLGDPTNISAPTGLSIAPDETFATAGMLTWKSENNAFIRRFEVSLMQDGEVLYRTELLARSWAIPLVDAGEYTVQVRAVSSLGTLSPPAMVVFVLAIPLPPTDIIFNVDYWSIEARPVQAGVGLGTRFELSIGSGGSIHGPANSITFTGLMHSTTYEVFARTVNAMGVSDWISRSVTTLDDISKIEDLIGDAIAESIFDDVVEELRGDLDDISDQITSSRQNIIEDALLIIDAADERTRRQSGQQKLQQSIREESEHRETDLSIVRTELNDEVANRKSEVLRVDQSVSNLAGSTAASLTDVNSRINAANINISANSYAIQQTSVTVNGHAIAITNLQSSVTNLATQTTGISNLLLSAELDAAGNTKATAALNTRVTNTQSDLANTQLILSSTVNELGQVSGRAYLGVTTVVGGRARINGIVIDGNTNTLEFRANTLRLTDTAGVDQLYFNTGLQKWVFSGSIVAATFQTATSGYRVEMSGDGNLPIWYGTGAKNAGNGLLYATTTGELVSRNQRVLNGRLEFVGGTHFRLESATPFGPHNLISYFGPKITGVNWNNSTGTLIESGILKSNAITFLDSSGNAYFGGSILAGTLKNAVQTTTLTAAPTVETGSFGSNGGLITVKSSFSASRFEIGQGSCPVEPAPSGIIYLDRWNGSSWVNVASQVVNGSYSCSQEGPGEFNQTWEMFGSFTYTDNLRVTTNRNYRLRATHSLPLLPNGSLRLSLITEE